MPDILSYAVGVSETYANCFFDSYGYFSTSIPLIRIEPDVIERAFVIILMVVDLPAPFGPKNP